MPNPNPVNQVELVKILKKMCEASGAEGDKVDEIVNTLIEALKQEFGENKYGELDNDSVKKILDPNSAFTKGKGLAALLDVVINDRTLDKKDVPEFMKALISVLNPDKEAKKESEKALDDLMKKLKLDPTLKEAFLAQVLLQLQQQANVEKDPKVLAKLDQCIKLVMGAKKQAKEDKAAEEQEAQIRSVSGGVGSKEGEYSVVTVEQLNPGGWSCLGALTYAVLNSTVKGEDERDNVEFASALKASVPSGQDDSPLNMALGALEEGLADMHRPKLARG